MKKLFFILFIPIFTNAQSVICNFKVIKDRTVIEDTLTTVTVDNITRKVYYTISVYKTTIYLENNAEYMLTFKRDNCINKQVYVNTKDSPTHKNYHKLLSVEMIDGNSSVYKYTGSMWYDMLYDEYVYKVRQ